MSHLFASPMLVIIENIDVKHKHKNCPWKKIINLFFIVWSYLFAHANPICITLNDDFLIYWVMSKWWSFISLVIVCYIKITQIGSWGQLGTHLGPVTPDEPHVGPMNLAISVPIGPTASEAVAWINYWLLGAHHLLLVQESFAAKCQRYFYRI